MNKKFIITIDTEGDNIWKKNYRSGGIKDITYRNGEYLLRFQTLCEKYNFIPTYLVNYEMTLSQPFVEMSRERLPLKKLEIGMHMHAWNTGDFYELPIGKKSGGGKPYIGEYPRKIMVQKVDYITKQLEDVFQTAITSHRSGRWYLDNTYIKILKQYGYLVDCTVTPGINWERSPGAKDGSKGTDYRKFPRHAYEMSLSDISKSEQSGIYEVPVSIVKAPYQFKINKMQDILNRNTYKKREIWLRPNGYNLKDMVYLVKEKNKSKSDYIEFMIHSSELMPGGSPTFPTKKSIENLYRDMDRLFQMISRYYEGCGLTDYIMHKKHMRGLSENVQGI